MPLKTPKYKTAKEQKDKNSCQNQGKNPKRHSDPVRTGETTWCSKGSHDGTRTTLP